MQVSAVSTNSTKTVFNTRAGNRINENHRETGLASTKPSSKNSNIINRNKLFDSINEWKLFCHRQIEKGNLDVII